MIGGGHLAGARQRPNLTVLADAMVDRVVLERGRVAGVRLVRDGTPRLVTASRVALAAGGVGTPVILQRSGIGEPAELAQRGITPLVSLPGVGRALIEHPAVPIWVLPKPAACRPGAAWYEVMARDGDPPDLGVFLAANVATGQLPAAGELLGDRCAAMVSAVLLDPTSRGRVCAAGPSPTAPPRIDLELLATGRDRDRLGRAVRLAWSVLRAGPFAEQLRGVLMWTDRMVADDRLLGAALRRWTTPLFHAAGTARMGPADDPSAVVDEHCRLHDVPGLWVCDTSIMPAPVTAPPNLTCLMIAERVAAWMH